MQHGKYQGPLAGLNVIDFGHYYAGPATGMLLADQGANVVKVVRPGGPELPEHQYRVFNRNKKLLELDLKTEEGKRQAFSLIEKADVLIENFRPGVMKRLGLDYASVKGLNPGLVYLSLPGFASTDKERAHIQAWEGIMGAAIGIYENYSLIRRGLGYPPLYTPLAHCSMYGSTHGATAIMAALLAREEHGYGTLLEVPLVDAGLSGCTTSFTSRLPTNSSSYSLDEDRKAGIVQAHKPFRYDPGDNGLMQTEKLGKAMRVIWPTYLTADGRQVECHDFMGGERLFKTLGIDRQLKKEGFLWEGVWQSDLDNNIDCGGQLSPERAARLRELVAEAFRSKTAEEWDKSFGDNSFVTIRTREEFLRQEPMLKSGVLTRMDNGQSTLTAPGRLCDVAGPGDRLMSGFEEMVWVDFAAAREFFQDFNPPKTIGPRPVQRKGDMLRGLKILDLANIMAVPMSCYILAQYGAEVITSVDINKSLFPGNLADMLEAGMSKRSILLDITTAPAREIMRRMIARSDLVVTNILDNTAVRMGVTHKDLQAINPEVVSCQASAWGGSHRGYLERRRGFDMGILAETGIEANFGSLEWPQYFGQGSVVDAMTATAVAYTSLLGVWQKRRTGYAGEARASLVRGNSYFQLPWMIEENGNSDWGEPRGQAARGNSWHQRLYQCSDGWIYVHVTQDRAPALVKKVCGDTNANEKSLEAAFVEKDCTHWLATLDAAAIACHKVLSVEDICAVSRPVDNEEANETASGALEMLCWEDHPCGIPVVLPAPVWVRVGEEQSYLRCRTAPRRGQHTVEILREVGYNEEDIARLIEVGVAHEYLPQIGSKDVYFHQLKKAAKRG